LPNARFARVSPVDRVDLILTLESTLPAMTDKCFRRAFQKIRSRFPCNLISGNFQNLRIRFT
jgi:hypothetical protein